MTKAELLAVIAEKTGATKVDVDTIFMAIFETITENLAKQDKIAVPKFGNFSIKIREERKGRSRVDRSDRSNRPLFRTGLAELPHPAPR